MSFELGFMRALTPRDLEFLELIAGSMGDFIEAALYRERLQDALAETQQLNEELQVQQEELRVSNEGLEERGRALMESQSRLEAQQAELEQTNVQLEEYAQRLERQKADLLRAQDELETNAARLEQSSRYKSEFLANMVARTAHTAEQFADSRKAAAAEPHRQSKRRAGALR